MIPSLKTLSHCCLRRLSRALASLGLLLPLVALSPAFGAQTPDLSGSARGIQLDVFSRLSPLEINSIHSWEVTLQDADGPLADATLTVEAGMPEHDHGMPTQPRVTRQIAPGRYLLEGVRFHMPGKWQLTATVEAAATARPVTIVIDFDL